MRSCQKNAWLCQSGSLIEGFLTVMTQRSIKEHISRLCVSLCGFLELGDPSGVELRHGHFVVTMTMFLLSKFYQSSLTIRWKETQFTANLTMFMSDFKNETGSTLAVWTGCSEHRKERKGKTSISPVVCRPLCWKYFYWPRKHREIVQAWQRRPSLKQYLLLSSLYLTVSNSFLL